MSDEVVLTWIKIGKPPLSGQKLARAFHGEAFIKADASEKKKMIDRCQKAVERRVPPNEIPAPLGRDSNRLKRRNTTPN
jgi:hypothetical protein